MWLIAKKRCRCTPKTQHQCLESNHRSSKCLDTCIRKVERMLPLHSDSWEREKLVTVKKKTDVRPSFVMTVTLSPCSLQKICKSESMLRIAATNSTIRKMANVFDLFTLLLTESIVFDNCRGGESGLSWNEEDGWNEDRLTLEMDSCINLRQWMGTLKLNRARICEGFHATRDYIVVFCTMYTEAELDVRIMGFGLAIKWGPDFKRMTGLRNSSGMRGNQYACVWILMLLFIALSSTYIWAPNELQALPFRVLRKVIATSPQRLIDQSTDGRAEPVHIAHCPLQQSARPHAETQHTPTPVTQRCR